MNREFLNTDEGIRYGECKFHNKVIKFSVNSKIKALNFQNIQPHPLQ